MTGFVARGSVTDAEDTVVSYHGATVCAPTLGNLLITPSGWTVHAPPASVGAAGGFTVNWSWWKRAARRRLILAHNGQSPKARRTKRRKRLL